MLGRHPEEEAEVRAEPERQKLSDLPLESTTATSSRVSTEAILNHISVLKS